VKNKFVIFSALLALCYFGEAYGAEVVQRASSAPAPAANRGRPAPVAIGTPRAAAPTAQVVEEIVMEEPVIIEELAPPEETKAAQFREVLQESGGAAALDDSDLKNLIAAQRAAEADIVTITTANIAPPSGGANVCNEGLRSCMREKCGEKFLGCATDGDTIWNDKMDSCRRTTKCTGREYDLLAPQIKADRDIEVNIGLFDEVLTCGERYNECIIGQCGTLFDGCLGKAQGDRAIANCKKIADECRIADSGMAGRAMEVFGMQRVDAEIRVRADYARLLEMRSRMEAECPKLGGVFDARSFDCVFSVCIFNNRLAPAGWNGGDYSLSCQKVHPGAKYICNPEWFGIDVTTFMEEAQRLTRAQTAASGAFMGGMLGAGAGTAMNAAMTGAMFNKGVTNTQQKKEDARDALEEECEGQGGVRKNNNCSFEQKDCKSDKKNTREWINGRCLTKPILAKGGGDNTDTEDDDDDEEEVTGVAAISKAQQRKDTREQKKEERKDDKELKSQINAAVKEQKELDKNKKGETEEDRLRKQKLETTKNTGNSAKNAEEKKQMQNSGRSNQESEKDVEDKAKCLGQGRFWNSGKGSVAKGCYKDKIYPNALGWEGGPPKVDMPGGNNNLF